jgi:hypothetical protein
MTVNIEIKTVKLSDIKLNPGNPRKISGKNMEKLVKSIREFPDMMQIREVVVDENMMAIGGNMRTLALKKAGEKHVQAKVVRGLTEDQKKEFVIKDNASFGEWDLFSIGDEWDELPLDDWGVPEEFCKLEGYGGEKLKQKDVELKPYDKIHVLISCDVDVVEEIQGVLDDLKKVDGIEIEQSAN